MRLVRQQPVGPDGPADGLPPGEAFGDFEDSIASFHARSRAAGPAGRGAGPDFGGVEFRRMLDHFRRVCDAVQFAHSRGIVHRDLKPANIVTGPFGETFVLDWGLARRFHVADSAGPGVPEEEGNEATTPATRREGTPAYISPEQSIDPDRVDKRSDIYSLGATLYQLLTGRPPFEGPDATTVIRDVRTGRLRPPREVVPTVPRPLEAICLKAMSTPREPRYSAVGALSEDIGNWVRGDPVSAWREPWPIRTRRWIRRHRTPVVAAAGALLVGLTLLASGWAWFRHREGRRLAQLSQAAESSLLTAVRLGGEARATGDLDRFGEAVLAARLSREFIGIERGLAASLPHIESVLSGLEQEMSSLRTQAETRARDRKMLASIEASRLQGATNFDFSSIAAAYDESFRAYGIEVGRMDPDEAAARIRSSAIREELAAALDDWACFADRDQARILVKISHQADPEPTRDAFRDALARNQVLELMRIGLTTENEKLPATFAFQLSRLFDYVGHAAESLRFLEAAYRAHPEDVLINIALAETLSKVKPPDHERAIGYARAAVALRPSSAAVLLLLANALTEARHFDEAAEAAQKAIELDPASVEASNTLAVIRTSQGRPDAALAAFREALRLGPKSARVHLNYGTFLHKRGNRAEALEALRKAVELSPDLSKMNIWKAKRSKRSVALALTGYGASLLENGNASDAVDAQRKAIKLDPECVGAYSNLGMALWREGRTEESLAAYKEGIRCNPRDASSHYNFGTALMRLERWNEAITEFRRALSSDPENPEILCNLGSALQQVGEFSESLAQYQKGHELSRRNPNWSYPSAAWVRRAEALAKLDQRLPAVLEKKEEPADARDAFNLMLLCYRTRLCAGATRLAEDAQRRWPDGFARGDDPMRALAARCAALAGCGRGTDVTLAGDPERARWRRMSLDWMRAGIADLRERLHDGQVDHPTVRRLLTRWKEDDALAGVRDDAALTKLPEPERDEWRSFWGEVDALRREAEPSVHR
jgi:serine/threonine-protein kinase